MLEKRTILILGFLVWSSTIYAQRYIQQIFPSSSVTTNIQYGSNTNFKGQSENLSLDFYEPTNDTVSQRPLLIYIHGGGFVDTNQSKSLTHIQAFADSLARYGYTVASINYRLDSSISNRAIINAMHDAKAAIRFFKANATTYSLDTSLFFIGGESAGAITAMNASYLDVPSEVNYPPTNPQAKDQSLEGASGNNGYSAEVKATLCFCGGTKNTLNELLFDTTAISLGDQPILFVHETNDALIHIAQAIEIAQRVTNLNIPNLFYTFSGATHCPWIFPLQNSSNYLDTLINYTVPFLYACVQNSTEVIHQKTTATLKIFPNPAKQSAIIQIKNQHSKQGILKILSQNGSSIEQQIVHIKDNQIHLDLQLLSSGLYWVEIDFPERKYQGELLILP